MEFRVLPLSSRVLARAAFQRGWRRRLGDGRSRSEELPSDVECAEARAVPQGLNDSCQGCRLV